MYGEEGMVEEEDAVHLGDLPVAAEHLQVHLHVALELLLQQPPPRQMREIGYKKDNHFHLGRCGEPVASRGG